MYRKKGFWIGVVLFVLNSFIVYAQTGAATTRVGDAGAKQLTQILSNPFWYSIFFLIVVWIFLSFLILFFMSRNGKHHGSRSIAFAGSGILVFSIFIINQFTGIGLVQRVQQVAGVVGFIAGILLGIGTWYFAKTTAGNNRFGNWFARILGIVVFCLINGVVFGWNGWILLAITAGLIILTFAGIMGYAKMPAGMRQRINAMKEDFMGAFPSKEDQEYVVRLFEEIENDLDDAFSIPNDMDRLREQVKIKRIKLKKALTKLQGRGTSQEMLLKVSHFFGPKGVGLSSTLIGLIEDQLEIVKNLRKNLHYVEEIDEEDGEIQRREPELNVAQINDILHRIAGEKLEKAPKKYRTPASRMEEFTKYWKEASKALYESLQKMNQALELQKNSNIDDAWQFTEEENMAAFYKYLSNEFAAFHAAESAAITLINGLKSQKLDIEKPGGGSDDDESIAEEFSEWYEDAGEG